MRIHLALVALLLVLLGCKKATTEPTTSPVLWIDLQQSFANDSVQVVFDQNLIFAGRVTTNNILSLAHSIHQPATRGSHEVRIRIVDSGVQADTTFMLFDTLTVAVQYIRSPAQVGYVFYPGLVPYR